jgi:hypothetical protein
MLARKCAILVRRDKEAVRVPCQVLERLRVLCVRDLLVQPADDGSDVRVERETRQREGRERAVRWVLVGNRHQHLGLSFALVVAYCAAEGSDAFFVQFFLQPVHTNHVHLLRFWQLDDAG